MCVHVWGVEAVLVNTQTHTLCPVAPLLPLTSNVATLGIYVNHLLSNMLFLQLVVGGFLALRLSWCHFLGEALPDPLWKTPISPRCSHFIFAYLLYSA